ncbi:MAG TPA: glycosyltransferase family 4 protein [Tepidisphaeraceae bacterium]|nr:glycosyltransferase family 4 protein [Tepidisphaeraceae bacterium]
MSAERARILFVDHTASLGGGEIALFNLVRHLDHGRYTPIVLLCSDGPLHGKLTSAGIETHVLPLAANVVNTRKDTLGAGVFLRAGAVLATLAYIRRLTKFIKAHEIDLVHTNSLKADVIGGVAARLARRKLIWHVRDRIDGDYLPPKVAKVFRWLSRMLPHYVIANSASTLLTLRHKGPINGAAVPSGIDLSTRIDVVHDGLAQRWAHLMADQLPDRHPVIGLVGRISPWKGQHVFINAAAEVRGRFHNVRFQIIGAALFAERDYEARVRDLVVSLGLQDCVEFTGFCDNVPERMAALDVLVHASTLGEPFGQVVIEGMAAGKPVIATNGGGIPEIIRDGDTGLLIPMNDHTAMANAIIYLLENPEAAHRMAERGPAWVREHFAIERTAELVQEIYQRVMHNVVAK